MIKDKSASESGTLESLSNETENRLRSDPIVNDFNRSMHNILIIHIHNNIISYIM